MINQQEGHLTEQLYLGDMYLFTDITTRHVLLIK